MAWIAALVAAAASTYGGIRQQQAAKRNANNASALNSLGGGGGGQSGFQPSADQFMEKSQGSDMNSLGLKDLLSTDKPEQQQMTLGKTSFSSAGQAPAAGASDKDFHLFGGNELDASKQPQQQPPQQQEKPLDQGMGTNDYIGLAQSAGQIASSLAQGPPAPPGFMPSPGPMNYQPTALQMLLARQKRGF